jgi:hypothetical protein
LFGSVRHCLVFVGSLLVGCGIRELEPSTDVILVVAPNLDRDALPHPGCLQRHALVHVLAGRCGGTDAELSADVDDQAVRGGVELAAAPHDDRLDA